MPLYENDPIDVDEDDNGLPALAGLATDAEVNFLDIVGERLAMEMNNQELTDLDRRVHEAHIRYRQMIIRHAKEKYKHSWMLGAAWCGLVLFHVSMAALGGANALNIAMLVAMSMMAGWEVKDVRLAHEKYMKELERGEE
jgi:hypothetical protein